jgi:hypothetical protein
MNPIRECTRCGFRVNLEGASPAGRERLTTLFEEHAAECPTLPSSATRRELKREVRKARFLYGESAAREAAERVLAKASREVAA